ncbi:MAG: hypothetical protein ACP5K9_01540 [Candidatus Micrarchaeia archaeon]
MLEKLLPAEITELLIETDTDKALELANDAWDSIKARSIREIAMVKSISSETCKRMLSAFFQSYCRAAFDKA